MINNPSPINEFIVTNMLPEDGVASIGWPIAIANDLQYLAQEPKHILSMRGNKHDYSSYLLTGTNYSHVSAQMYYYLIQFTGDFPDSDFIATFSIDDFEVARWTKESELVEWLDPSYDPDTSLRRARYTMIVSPLLFLEPEVIKFSYSVIVPVISPLVYIENVSFDIWSQPLLNTDYLTELV